MPSSQEFKLELELYRFLRVGEIMDRFDQCLNDEGSEWTFVATWDHGKPRPSIYKPIRRKLSPLPYGPEVVASSATGLTNDEAEQFIEIAETGSVDQVKAFWATFLRSRGIVKV